MSKYQVIWWILYIVFIVVIWNLPTVNYIAALLLFIACGTLERFDEANK